MASVQTTTGTELPPGFEAVSRMRYLFAGRASKVTPSGRLQSCIIVVLVDAVLVCTHRGGVHRYLPIEAIRSLTTFPRGWLLLNCSGPVPGTSAVAVEPSKVHDLMLVLSVPQRLIEVLQRVRAARTGTTLFLSNSDQIPSLADFRLRPLESAATHAPVRMWALAAAANTQNALDILSNQLENQETPGLHLVPRARTVRHNDVLLAHGKAMADREVLPVKARGPNFPYAPSPWLFSSLLTTAPSSMASDILASSSSSHLLMCVAKFVPTREQRLAASFGEGGLTNGTASVIFPLHFQIAAVLSFAYARFPHVAVLRGDAYSDATPSVNIRFLAPKSTLEKLKKLGYDQMHNTTTGNNGKNINSNNNNTNNNDPFKPIKVAESFMFCVMQKYAEKVLHIVSVQRQIIGVTGGITQLPPVNTEGAAFWRNPRIALFGDTSHVK